MAQRIKASKKKYEKAFGKALEEPDINEDGDLPNQSQNSKIETTKSLNPNEDLSSDNSESISELKTKKDETLGFSFKEFVRGPRDLNRATSFINYLNSCEGDSRKRLLASQWFLPLVTKAIRDLINPSQLRIPMTLTDSDQGLVRYMLPGFNEGPPDKYRALYILRDFSERTPKIQVQILNDFGTYMRKAFRDALAPEPISESEQSAEEVLVEDDSSDEEEDGEEEREIMKGNKSRDESNSSPSPHPTSSQSHPPVLRGYPSLPPSTTLRSETPPLPPQVFTKNPIPPIRMMDIPQSVDPPYPSPHPFTSSKFLPLDRLSSYNEEKKSE